MTLTHPSRLRLLLGVAAAVLLTAGTLATWLLPHPIATDRPAGHTQEELESRDCDGLFGLAKRLCADDVGGGNGGHCDGLIGPGGQACEEGWRGWPLLFAGSGTAAAVGLAVLAGRRDR